jgi:hypothetical protein
MSVGQAVSFSGGGSVVAAAVADADAGAGSVSFVVDALGAALVGVELGRAGGVGSGEALEHAMTAKPMTAETLVGMGISMRIATVL